MEREIKFRIRDKKDMLFFDDLREMDFSDYCDFNKLMDRILPLMQYTWLKDKHWKEIYEGDILYRLHFGEYVWIWNVEYTDRLWRYRVHINNTIYFDVSNETDREIKWNIYENPDLLSKSEDETI